MKLWPWTQGVMVRRYTDFERALIGLTIVQVLWVTPAKHSLLHYWFAVLCWYWLLMPMTGSGPNGAISGTQLVYIGIILPVFMES
ncbi:hypothetical protein FJQ87_13125 [Shewanella sp. SNU WT4]|nr:hypothetical protein FJQ87_13125 [Shewanella sp. SNU WT4]